MPASPPAGSKRAAAAAPRSKPKKVRLGRESAAGRRERTAEILARLEREYPDAHCALDHRSPLELLVATILSAQCTDERVNKVTPELFRRLPTARHLAEAPIEEIEELVKTTGFFRNKARALQGLGIALVEEHGGRVPDTMAELVELPGVGRKTANVVLGNAFGHNVGIVVDTHVQRLTGLLGLSAEKDPEKIERVLMALVPQPSWTLWSHLLIEHGRKVCVARRPECARCVLSDLCPSSLV
ncbi:MAG TPA: endonuclease III [Thermoanaerobaculia bacterium]|nr:endonuclease III [Thermoanaerobaculia bacterium]